MPHWVKIAFDWATKPAVTWSLLGISLVSFVAGFVGVRRYLGRLPADYFSRSDSARPPKRRTLDRVFLGIVKNAVGLLLIVTGIAALVLPGQGVATIVVGLLMLDFPGKARLERRILALPPILRTVNAFRHRMGQQPLIVGR